MTDGLSNRLLQAIEEREKTAQSAVAESRMRDWPEGVPDWDQSEYSGNVYYRDTNAMVATGGFGDLDEEAGKHIALNDPRSVLALCQAHREIVEWHTNDHDLLRSSRPTIGCRCYGGWPCPTLRALARGYNLEGAQ